MKPKVYIDGKAGTTGLQIYDRLAARDDIELLLIDEAKRKDPAARKELMNAADIVFLCLPDAAAVEAVRLVENPGTRIIDTSTAHRTAPGWAYGFPELSEAHREAIRSSKRVANPGCHATGFISIVYPLVKTGVLPEDALLSCFSLTGYSGGGKTMIAAYEAPCRPPHLDSPGVYALPQTHKHLPEMQKVCGLVHPPVFCPIVDNYYSGMLTTVSLHRAQLSGIDSLQALWQVLWDYYGGEEDAQHKRPVSVDYDPTPNGGREPFDRATKLYGNTYAETDKLDIVICGNDERYTVMALFDNLGKGASGAAVQNMNLMLGFEETKGLCLE